MVFTVVVFPAPFAPRRDLTVGRIQRNVDDGLRLAVPIAVRQRFRRLGLSKSRMMFGTVRAIPSFAPSLKTPTWCCVSAQRQNDAPVAEIRTAMRASCFRSSR